MARRRPARWSLFVLVPAALALGGSLGGCGTGAHARPKLRAVEEQRLLTLISRARVDAAGHNRAGVRGSLVQFVDEVDTLRSDGELTLASATAMKRQALATAALAAKQWPLRPAASTSTTQEISGTVSQTANTAAQSQPGQPAGPGQPGQQHGPGQPGGPDEQQTTVETTPPGQSGPAPAKPSPTGPTAPTHAPPASPHHPWWVARSDGPGHGGPRHPAWHGWNGGGHG